VIFVHTAALIILRVCKAALFGVLTSPGNTSVSLSQQYFSNCDDNDNISTIMMKAGRSGRLPLTHFLCIPLVTFSSRPQLRQSLERFKTAVGAHDSNSDAPTTTIPSRAIRPVDTLHLTIGVMSLNKEQLAAAISLLGTLSLNSLLQDTAIPSQSIEAENEKIEAPPENHETVLARNGDPIAVDLTGLSSMHEPQNTSILYCAPVDPTSRLQCLALSAQNAFRENGFLVADNRPLKLHATIVNTIYAKEKKREPKTSKVTKVSNPGPSTPFAGTSSHPEMSQTTDAGHGPRANSSRKLDARGLLEEFNGFVWAKEVVVDRLAICEMGAKKITDEHGNITKEEYTEVAATSLLPR
jgi:activating signal cointegrator complex subunit 1